ncbi:MAG: 8-amino-7-oxononanoate synthase [Microthrixaceae bacterium]
MTTWARRIALHNAATRDVGRWRTVRTLDSGAPATTVSADGRRVATFASNDYLGLSQNAAVVSAAHAALDRYGTGSGAARLIVGGRPIHDELEAALAQWCERHDALLFPSGYQANVGVIGALARCAPGLVVFSDELNHASIIDGCRLARAEIRVFRHADVDHLGELLAEHAPPGSEQPSIVVTDSVFSMDGDRAPLDEIAGLCASHDTLLVVDEAHAVLADRPPPGSVVVGTLSKTLGSAGGFVAADRELVALCRNTSRSFIFTTAGTPADTAAALAALEVLRSDEGALLVDRLRANVDRLAPGHDSPILPILLGDERRAIAVADALLERGVLVPAIRPPTVAPGTCRLRVAVSAAHTHEQIDLLRETLDDLGVTW